MPLAAGDILARTASNGGNKIEGGPQKAGKRPGFRTEKPKSGRPYKSLAEEVEKDTEKGGTEESGTGDGEDPGQDDATSDAPADGGKAAGSAYSDDGAGDGVCGADGDSEMGGAH